jgi:N-glycosylase/DNA lyase
MRRLARATRPYVRGGRMRYHAMILPHEYIGPWEKFRPVIESRLREFAAVPSEEYFYELLYCLLTPQTKAEHAQQAVDELRGLGFPAKDVDVAGVLRTSTRYVRFHNQKAERIRRLQEDWDRIQGQLTAGIDSVSLREWLVAHVHGYGWKEASHALRNIGHFDLAIIDRHVITHLVRTETIPEKPRYVSPKLYLELERRFVDLAARFDCRLQELDLLFWGIEEGTIRK